MSRRFEDQFDMYLTFIIAMVVGGWLVYFASAVLSGGFSTEKIEKALPSTGWEVQDSTKITGVN